METIASFEVDHTVLKPGMYLSRVDHGVTTYDLRFVFPNAGEYLPTAAMHTVEHLFAVKARNGVYGENIIYFGPMGCRTGFYLLTVNMTHAQAVELVRSLTDSVCAFEGEIPGSTERECGNYREHDLAGAKEICKSYAKVMENWTERDIYYA